MEEIKEKPAVPGGCFAVARISHTDKCDKTLKGMEVLKGALIPCTCQPTVEVAPGYEHMFGDI